MAITWIQSESTESPNTVDLTSTPGIVFVRKNISTFEREQDDGTTITYYSYQEAKMTLAQYEEYENETVEDRFVAIEEALCDIDMEG